MCPYFSEERGRPSTDGSVKKPIKKCMKESFNLKFYWMALWVQWFGSQSQTLTRKFSNKCVGGKI